MAGIPVNKDIINGRAGYLVKTLRDTLAEVGRLKAYFDSVGTPGLTGLGFTTDEAALLGSAFGDLDKVRRIANGQDTQAEASDFFFWAKRLTGIE